MRSRLFSFRTAVLSVLFLIISVSPLRADDGGSWINVQANKAWENGMYGFLRLEHRSNNNFGSTEAAFLAAGAGYRVLPWLKADLSYEGWQVNPEITLHKAVISANASMVRDGLSVSIREKLEIAANPAASSVGYTLRSRLRAQYAIPDSALRPYAMAEVFNWQSWIRSLYYAGVEITLDAHNMFDLFYLYHLPAGAPAVHVLGVGYYFNF